MSTLENTTLENMTPGNTTPENTVPVTNTRRPRLCGHCRGEGHDRRTCPAPEQVERRRLSRIALAEHVQQRLQQRPDNRNSYNIFNNNNYPVYVYWSNTGEDIIKFIKYTSEYSDVIIKALPRHRLVFIPTTEFIVPPVERSSINLSQCNYFIAGDFNLQDFDSLTIHLIKEYQRPKTDLEQWKECGLKSLFLIKELERMGGKKYDNLEPIFDMIQDIKLPEHTEMDKEQAGVPSVFTNVT